MILFLNHHLHSAVAVAGPEHLFDFCQLLLLALEKESLGLHSTHFLFV